MGRDGEKRFVLSGEFWTAFVTAITLGGAALLWAGKVDSQQTNQERRTDTLEKRVDETRSQIHDDLQHINDKLDYMRDRLPTEKAQK